MNNYFMGSHHLAPLDRCPMAPASITLVVSTPFTCCNCCTKVHHLSSYLSYLSYFSYSSYLSCLSYLYLSQWCPLHLPAATAAQNQGGITCGPTDEASRSSKAIEKHVIINFCDKNAVIACFPDKMMFL